MEVLLDSHVLLWWASEPDKLSVAARSTIEDPDNGLWASAASAWEISIKVRAGKLALDVQTLFRRAAAEGIGFLGIGIDDAINAGSLDWTHRDPFDRMIAAQAQRAGFRLLTRDAAFNTLPGLDVVQA